jgi:hypothetical protein
MILRLERQRLVDFVSAEEGRLLPELQALRRKSIALNDFVLVAEGLFSILRTSLEHRIALSVDRVGQYNPDLASERLNVLAEGIQAILSFFGSVAAGQATVPRELYELVSWFFAQCKGVTAPPQYVLSPGEAFETVELHQFLDTLFFRPPNRYLFPELKKLSREPFFFIFLPVSSASAEGALDWPIIFHECVHAVEEKSNVVGKLFPGLPRRWRELEELANHYDVAKHASQTIELICDIVAVRVAGPAYLWRFLRRSFSLADISHYSVTHPNTPTRLRYLIKLIASQGFVKEAKAAGALMKEILRDLRQRENLLSADSLPSALKEADRYYSSRILLLVGAVSKTS